MMAPKGVHCLHNPYLLTGPQRCTAAWDKVGTDPQGFTARGQSQHWSTKGYVGYIAPAI